MSTLEKSSVVEAAALRSEVETRVAGLAGKFRKAAAAEMHSTTRRALHHNQALTSVLATLRSRLLHLREENHRLKGTLEEVRIQEAVQRNTVCRLSTQNHRRAVLLEKVTKRAEEHAKQHQQFTKLSKEAEQLRKDLRLQQAQLDATTDLTSQLKEKATERDIALELTAVRLQEEDAIKRSLLSSIRSALHILQRATFRETAMSDEGGTGEGIEKQEGTVPVEILLKQLVELLSNEENKASNDRVTDAREVKRSPDPLLTYAAGDLGLLPKLQNKSKK